MRLLLEATGDLYGHLLVEFSEGDKQLFMNIVEMWKAVNNKLTFFSTLTTFTLGEAYFYSTVEVEELLSEKERELLGRFGYVRVPDERTLPKAMTEEDATEVFTREEADEFVCNGDSVWWRLWGECSGGLLADSFAVPIDKLAKWFLEESNG